MWNTRLEEFGSRALGRGKNASTTDLPGDHDVARIERLVASCRHLSSGDASLTSGSGEQLRRGERPAAINSGNWVDVRYGQLWCSELYRRKNASQKQEKAHPSLDGLTLGRAGVNRDYPAIGEASRQFQSGGPDGDADPDYMSKEKLEHINSISKTGRSFDSCDSCKRLGFGRLHELGTRVKTSLLR